MYFSIPQIAPIIWINIRVALTALLIVTTAIVYFSKNIINTKRGLKIGSTLVKKIKW